MMDSDANKAASSSFAGGGGTPSQLATKRYPSVELIQVSGNSDVKSITVAHKHIAS